MGRHQTGEGKASAPIVRAEIRHSFLALETTGSQELRWASHILITGRAEMGRVQAKSSKVAKTDASPCQAGIPSPTPHFWAQQREQLKRRAKEVSAMEQHHHELLCAF